MRYLLLLILALNANFIIKAGEIKYPASTIDPSLKANANAVVRIYDERVRIIEGGAFSRKVTYAITVLNEKGQEYSNFTEYYDKKSKISNITATVYDANGEKIKKLGSSDISDQSAISGYSVFEDNRVKLIRPNYRTIPFTVEYSFEFVQNDGFSLPNWNPVMDFYVTVEKSTFKVSTATPDDFLYKELNFDNHITTNKEIIDGHTVFSWELSNYPALIPEPFSPSGQRYIPLLMTAPAKFKFDGYSGEFKSWKGFGDFITQLNQGRQILPDETVVAVNEIVKNCSSDREKVRKLYEYMQQKTRYVSVQIGIGGYQPFPAENVDRLGYGDCKALSNYMKSLLDVAHIKSHYVLINAGSNAPSLIQEFPCSQFNHATLCVPMQPDTIWLECTSQISPFGFIGDFTDDRLALLIDTNESRLVKTKAYSLNDNIQTTNVQVKVQANGNAEAQFTTWFKGSFYDDHMGLMQKDEKDKREAISNWVEVPSFVLQSFKLSEEKSEQPAICQQLNVLMQNQLTNMGSRVLMNLNTTNRLEQTPKAAKNRKNQFEIRRPKHEVDTINYELPAGFKIEKYPEPVKISSKFGEYQAECKVIQNQIVYVRDFKIFKGNYEPAEYEAFRDYLSKIVVADQAKCIIQKSL